MKAEELKQSFLAPLASCSSDKFAIVKSSRDQVSSIMKAEEQKQSLLASLGLPHVALVSLP